MTDHTDYQPPGPWRFDEGVADVFEAMLARSIPQYEVMRRTVHDLAELLAVRVAPSLPMGDELQFVDLGASRGDVIGDLLTTFGGNARYTAIEVAPAMLDVLRDRFETQPMVTVVDHDLRKPWRRFDVAVVTAVLTLMFIPIEHRGRVVTDAYDSLAPGGAMIVVEKVIGPPRVAGILDTLYRDLKRTNGYTGEEVDRKALSLEGVLVPVTAAWNEQMLRGAGFAEVECVWRWMNFAAWVAVKA